MSHATSILIYLSGVILGSFYPVVIKNFPNITIWAILFVIMNTQLLSLVIMAIEADGDKEKFSQNYMKAFEDYNPLFSTGSLVSSYCSIIGTALLPVVVSVPLKQLVLVSSTLSDYYINGDVISKYEIIAIAMLIIGAIVVNADKIISGLSSTASSSYGFSLFHLGKYGIGIMAILCYIVLSGLLFTVYYDYADEETTGTTMNIRSNVGTIIITLLVIGLVSVGHTQIPPFKTLFLLWLGTLFCAAGALYIRYREYDMIDESDAIILNTSGLVFSVIWGILLLKEKISIFKVLGCAIIISATLVGLIE